MTDPVLLQTFDGVLRKGDLKKIQILEAAIEVIAKEGIEGTTFESIGQKIGLHKAHVAYHFKDKNQIIQTVIRYITSKAQATTIEHILRARTPEARIFAILEGAFAWAESHPTHVASMTLFYHYCTYNRKYAQLNSQIREDGATRIVGLLGKTSQKNLKVAKAIQAIITGAVIEAGTTSSSPKNRKLLKDSSILAIQSLLANSKNKI